MARIRTSPKLIQVLSDKSICLLVCMRFCSRFKTYTFSKRPLSPVGGSALLKFWVLKFLGCRYKQWLFESFALTHMQFCTYSMGGWTWDYSLQKQVNKVCIMSANKLLCNPPTLWNIYERGCAASLAGQAWAVRTKSYNTLRSER